MTRASASSLALLRLAFFSAVLVLSATQDLADWLSFDVAWQRRAVLYWLELPQPSQGAVSLLQAAWRFSLACAAIGLGTRLATASSFLLGLYLLQLPNHFGFGYHYDNLLVTVLFVLAVARTGDAYSVDSWLARGARPAVPAGEYQWPVQLLRGLWCLMFFAAAVSKWRASGFDWVASGNMRLILLRHEYTHAAPTNWALALAQLPLVCNVLALSALLLETTAPLALVSTHARRIIVPSLFVMQIVVGLVLGTFFWSNLICYLCWLDWPALASSLRARRARGTVITE